MDDLPILAFAPAQTVKLGRNGVKNAEFPVPLDPGGRLPSSNGLDQCHANTLRNLKAIFTATLPRYAAGPPHVLPDNSPTMNCAL